MKIVIDIPKEFEEHFKSDRFEDSFSRVASDIESFGFQLAGRYEKETITMLRKAIKDGTPLPEHHGRLIEVTAQLEQELFTFQRYTGIDEAPYESATMIIDDAPTIIEADKEVQE